MKKSGISNQAWVLCHDAKVPDISCVKALKAAHISSWTVSLAVLEDFFLKFLKDLQAKECWQVFWFSCLFFPMIGKQTALLFSFQFPTEEPWEVYVILGLESRAACRVILNTEDAGGAFCLLAASREWWEHHIFSEWYNYSFSSAGPSLHLLPRVCWLPQACASHDLLFLFQKVKYSGWFIKDWSFFLQLCSCHNHQNWSSKHFGEKESH